MSDVKDYCEKMHKRLIGLKAGLYDVMVQADSVPDAVHSDAAKQLKTLVADIASGIDELNNQCPSDWSPNRKTLDENMTKLTDALNKMADHAGVTIPDTTAWV